MAISAALPLKAAPSL